MISAALAWLSNGALAQGVQSTDAEIIADVTRLVAAARQLDTAWPWQAPVPEIAVVVAHGEAAARELASQLQYSSVEQWGTSTWDLHVEQQVALALCEIFAVQPEAGRTVYSVRAKEDDNVKVRAYWREKVGLPP